MKKCHDIEDLLPLYAEGVLSDAEKHSVDDHLAGCARCRGELAYLQEARRLVDELPAIEEPPWFQQKIMVRVREEAEKKSFARRWFYPLSSRIPLQVVATLVVAVLAVYIYRSGDERVKDILPGARQPVYEMKQEQAPAAARDARDQASPAAPLKKSVMPKESGQDKQTKADLAFKIGAQKLEAPRITPDAAHQTDVDSMKGLTESKDDSNEVLQARQNKSVQSVPKMADKQKVGTGSMLTDAVKRESYKKSVSSAPSSMTASALVAKQARISLEVDNLDAALTDVEKALAQFDAQKVTKQDMEGRISIRAEIPSRNWKDLLSKLNGVGQVKEKDPPGDIGQRSIHVMIEISERQLMTR